MEKYKEALRTAGLLKVGKDDDLPIPTRAMHSAQQSLDYIDQIANGLIQDCTQASEKETEMPIY